MRSIADVHLAVDLIRFPKTVANAVLHAVGNSLVANTLEAAKKHAFNENGRRFKVASLDGTLIAVNGSMSGGQTRCRSHSMCFMRMRHGLGSIRFRTCPLHAVHSTQASVCKSTHSG